LLRLETLSRAGLFRDVSFTLHAGEIVGLAGLVGAGRSELARAVYGLYPCEAGSMRLRGRPWAPRNAHESLAAGLVYLPEERKRQGLVLDHSIGDSISIGFSDLLVGWGVIRGRAEQARVDHAMKTCDVRATSPMQPVGTLSGGNQQKTILARWLERGPEIILLDEPTRGVDVGAKAEIHALIDRLAGQGCGVLLISSDLPEVLGLSDRVLVMHRGTIAAELRGEAMTQENVILAASGLHRAHPV
jgi:rhamnose transport system ATP-binding protein